MGKCQRGVAPELKMLPRSRCWVGPFTLNAGVWVSSGVMLRSASLPAGQGWLHLNQSGTGSPLAPGAWWAQGTPRESGLGGASGGPGRLAWLPP